MKNTINQFKERNFSELPGDDEEIVNEQEQNEVVNDEESTQTTNTNR